MKSYVLVFCATLAMALFTLSFLSFFGSPLKLLFPAVFGEIDLSAPPSQTLVAPFAAPELLKEGVNTMNTALEKGAAPKVAASFDTMDVPVGQPHRKTAVIAAWAQDTAVQSVTVDNVTLEKHFESLAPFYNPYALGELKAYFDQLNLSETIGPGRLRMIGFSDQPPVLVQEGVVQDVYKWLFDVPVLVSFVPMDLKTYRGATRNAQKLMVRVQVGRTGKADHNGLELERWMVQTARTVH